MIPQHKRLAAGERGVGMKTGGSVKGAKEMARAGKHDDADMDKAMIKKMVKPGSLRKR